MRKTSSRRATIQAQRSPACTSIPLATDHYGLPETEVLFPAEDFELPLEPMTLWSTTRIIRKAEDIDE
jgi:hypothetical protein